VRPAGNCSRRDARRDDPHLLPSGNSFPESRRRFSVRRRTLEALLKQYLPALRIYLMARRSVTAEAADLVILVDDLGRVPEAIRISRRSMKIARESVWAGLGLSGIAMLFAAAGKIAPVPGALLQEVIDIAVIINALRASAGPRQPVQRPIK